MEEVNNVVNTEKKGFSTAALVLGIVSVALCCIFYLSIPCAVLAIVFGIIGRKKGGKGMGTAGLVLGIIALGLYVILFVVGAGAALGLSSALAGL